VGRTAAGGEDGGRRGDVFVPESNKNGDFESYTILVTMGVWQGVTMDSLKYH
jgi:hypothetical protein